MTNFDNEQHTELEKPNHNIFSRENYGIGRLEFIGCLILVYIIVYISALIIGFSLGLTGMDKGSIHIIGNFIFWLISFITLTNTYAHRLYHIGWTDDTNSKAIAAQIMFILVSCAFMPNILIIPIVTNVIWLIFTLVLALVPGENE